MSNRGRTHFTDTLNEQRAGGLNAKRTSAAARTAKISIRQMVLDEIGHQNAFVFDAFGGHGEMYEAVWSRAASYAGVDLDWWQDARLMWAGDSARVMRSIDLTPYTVFDFDPYGSPYTQLTVLAARRSVVAGERLGLVITDGSGLRLKMGWIPDALALLSGLRRHMPGVARNHEDIIARALRGLCRRMNCRIVKQWQAKGRSASALHYIGLVVEGLEAA
jgi:hypothetical protein